VAAALWKPASPFARTDYGPTYVKTDAQLLTPLMGTWSSNVVVGSGVFRGATPRLGTPWTRPDLASDLVHTPML